MAWHMGLSQTYPTGRLLVNSTQMPYNIFGCLSCNCLPSLCHVIADGEAAPDTKRRKKRSNKRLRESVSSALIIEVSQANITSALV